MFLSNLRINYSPSLIIILSIVVFLFFCLQAVQKNIEVVGSMDYPPIRGGSDQVDYHVMGYTLATEGYPGKIHNQGMRIPFSQFEKSHSGELRPSDKRLLDAYLKNRNEAKPKPYAYRPWLYPIFLGIGYKIFGYTFETGRYVNVVLYGASATIIFLSLFLLIGKWSSFAGIIIFSTVTNLTYLTTQFLTEPSVAFALSLLFISLLLAGKYRQNQLCPGFIGLALGLCVLSKQIFAPLAFLILIFYFVGLLLDREKLRFTIKQVFTTLIMFLMIVVPWFSYNIATTGNSSLLTGTSGWHDMPSAYDSRIIDGENRFKIREEIFNQYSKDNEVTIQGDVARALYGRQIFFENMKSGLYKENFWGLFVFKFNDELWAKNWEWAVRIIAIIGIFALPWRVALPTAAVLLGASVLFGLTISVGGRAADAFWPLICGLAGIGTSFIFTKVKDNGFYVKKTTTILSYSYENKLNEVAQKLPLRLKEKSSQLISFRLIFMALIGLISVATAFWFGTIFGNTEPIIEPTKTVRILAFGQSNMLGAYGPAPKSSVSIARLRAWDWSSDKWVPAVLGTRPFGNIVGTSEPANNLAYVFADQLSETCSVNVDIVLLAANGKRIEYFLPNFILEQSGWVNNQTSPPFGNSLADEILGSNGDAIKALQASGGNLFEIVLIHQGEANNEDILKNATPYQKKLNSLFNEIKARKLSDANTSIIVGGINPGYPGGLAHYNAIMDLKSSKVGIVDWTGIEDVGDISSENNQHATGPGLTELGNRYFNEFMRINGCLKDD